MTFNHHTNHCVELHNAFLYILHYFSHNVVGHGVLLLWQ